MNDPSLEPLKRLFAAKTLKDAREALAAGADVNGRIGKRTAIFGATGPVLKFLLDQGADPNVLDDAEGSYGDTPLTYACCHTLVKSVETLVARGADVNLVGRQGLAPLTLAAHGKTPKHLAMVSCLLAAGAKPNVVRASDGITPLYFAAIDGSPEIVQALLAAGAAIDFGAEVDATALNGAVHCGREDIIPVLLAAGANPHARNSPTFSDPSRRGRNAIELARAGSRKGIAKLFEGY